MRSTTVTCLTIGLLAACGGNSDAPADPATLDSQLSQRFGGLTAEDGLEVDLDLGDEADTVGEADEGPDLADAERAIEDAENGSMPPGMRPEVYVVTLLWGRTFDEQVEQATVWNPTIETSCGRLVVRRRVRLEANDFVVRPRIDLRRLEVRSTTRPHHDGLSFIVHVPRGTACEGGPTLRFESAPQPMNETYTATAALRALSTEALFAPLPNDQFIAAVAEKVEPNEPGCRKGRALGYWARVPESNGGLFLGRVVNRYDQPIGRLGGLWGVPDAGDFAGEQVFFGMIVRGAGRRFEGLVAGRYTESSTAAPTAGTLQGAWHVVANYRQYVGGFTGAYAAGVETGDGVGLFLGEYASEACALYPPPVPLED